jgi:glycosyltransferase involved in cell wall biosynthesis
MATPDRHVLHILPHPGGGGETYVQALEAVHGYAMTREFLAPSARIRTSTRRVVKGVVQVNREASHYDLVHVHGEVAGTLSLPALARNPSVLTLHGLNLVRRVAGPLAAAARANLRAIIGAADRVICVTQAELDEIEAVDLRLGAKCAVIPNGVELPPPATAIERKQTRTALGIGDETVLALWVGTLKEPKQPQVAVRAAIACARRDVPVHLAVVGAGPLQQEAECAAAENPSVVSFLGHRDDVQPLLAAADVFVLSSLREGLPFSLLEAMAMGLPSVVAAGGGMEDVLGETGIAVQPGDESGLTDALAALATEPVLRARLARTARARATAEFAVAQMRARTHDVYEQVLQEQKVF